MGAKVHVKRRIRPATKVPNGAKLTNEVRFAKTAKINWLGNNIHLKSAWQLSWVGMM